MEKELVIGKSKTGKGGKLKHVIELVTPVGNWDSPPLPQGITHNAMSAQDMKEEVIIHQLPSSLVKP